jgi:hypothetical protein
MRFAARLAATRVERNRLAAAYAPIRHERGQVGSIGAKRRQMAKAAGVRFGCMESSRPLWAVCSFLTLFVTR